MDNVWAQVQGEKPDGPTELLVEIENPPVLPGKSPDMASFVSTPQIDLKSFDDLYIGINDGNDGFGVDAGMACDIIDTSTSFSDPNPPGYTIGNVAISLELSHTWIGDLVLKLRSPNGTIATMLSRPGLAESADDGIECCGNNENIMGGVAIAFDDLYPYDAEGMGDAAVSSGKNVCSDNGRCLYHPNPDSAGPPLNFANAFIGGDARGEWTLCVGDASELDFGNFEAWELFVQGTTPSAVGLQEIAVSTAVDNSLKSALGIVFILLLSTLLILRNRTF